MKPQRLRVVYDLKTEIDETSAAGNNNSNSKGP
jgi:hypothetical protein